MARVVDRAGAAGNPCLPFGANFLDGGAVAYFREAAQVAAERWDNAEAVHTSRALASCRPGSTMGRQRELELAILLELGPMLLESRGLCLS